MGFRELQMKITRNFWEESKTQKHQYTSYEPSSFFPNLSTGRLRLQQCANKTEKVENES